jgi:hypothetical protein
VEKSEGHTPLAKRKDNIQMKFKELGKEKGVEWVQLATYRDKWRALVSMVMKFRAP